MNSEKRLELFIGRLYHTLDEHKLSGFRYPNGEFRPEIVEEAMSFLKLHYNDDEIPEELLTELIAAVEHNEGLPSASIGCEGHDRRRNIANIGYSHNGRDYQWEREDLEPGHWEDHMSPPDWMVEGE